MTDWVTRFFSINGSELQEGTEEASGGSANTSIKQGPQLEHVLRQKASKNTNISNGRRDMAFLNVLGQNGKEQKQISSSFSTSKEGKTRYRSSRKRSSVAIIRSNEEDDMDSWCKVEYEDPLEKKKGISSDVNKIMDEEHFGLPKSSKKVFIIPHISRMSGKQKKNHRQIQLQQNLPWLIPGEHIHHVIEDIGYLKTSYETEFEDVDISTTTYAMPSQNKLPQQGGAKNPSTSSINNNGNTISNNSSNVNIDTIGTFGGYFGFYNNAPSSEINNTEYQQILLGTLYVTNYRMRYVYKLNNEDVERYKKSQKKHQQKLFHQTVSSNTSKTANESVPSDPQHLSKKKYVDEKDVLEVGEEIEEEDDEAAEIDQTDQNLDDERSSNQYPKREKIGKGIDAKCSEQNSTFEDIKTGEYSQENGAKKPSESSYENKEVNGSYKCTKKTKTLELVVSIPLLTIQKIEEKYPHGESAGPDTIFLGCSGYITVRGKDLQEINLLFYPSTSKNTNATFNLLTDCCSLLTIEKIFCFSFRQHQKGDVFANYNVDTPNDNPLSLSKHASIQRMPYKFTEEEIQNGWNVYDFFREFTRQGILNATEDSMWRITHTNMKYELCDTYPKELIVPKNFSEEKLMNAATFRSRRRIPVLSWKHPYNGTSICRSSQPLVGISRSRSYEDEELLDCILSTCPGAANLYIVDARPKANAFANTFIGKGYENTNNYNKCIIEFMGIDNIHTMSNSFSLLTKFCQKSGDWYWLSNLESSGWFKHLSYVLISVRKIVEYIEKKNCPVLIHCSDGWDRTSQLSALSQLLLDPYYRTIKGFEVLIEKEWIRFGYKFLDRTGHLKKNANNEVSPIFLQFIDCVWQIWQQFPSQFEFNEVFLITILDHLYSGLFGNFLLNSEKQRVEVGICKKTVSLWTFINTDLHRYTNALYKSDYNIPRRPVPLNPQQIKNGEKYVPPVHSKRAKSFLVPDPSIQNLSMNFWIGYYFRYKMGMKAKFGVMMNNAVTKLSKENLKIKKDLCDQKMKNKILEKALKDVVKRMESYKKLFEQSQYPPVLIEERGDDGVMLSLLQDNATNNNNNEMQDKTKLKHPNSTLSPMQEEEEMNIKRGKSADFVENYFQ